MGTLISGLFFFKINVHWETFFEAGVLTQTNSLGVPLPRTWGLHPIAIAMVVYPYALTKWRTAYTLTLCHTYQIRIKALNSVQLCRESNVPVCLGDKEISVVSECRHMGITLTTQRMLYKKAIQERIGAGKSTLLAARGIGSHSQPVTPTVLSKVYWTISVPKMTYGVEVVPIDEANLNDIETGHRQNAKIVQNLPNMAHKPAVLATLGWMSMKSYIAYRKMIFLWSILCLHDTNIYKVITLFILDLCYRGDIRLQGSPICDMYEQFVKYKLHNYLMESITSKCIEELDCMKAYLKNMIWQNETESWVATKFLYPELELYYSVIDKISINVWWRFTAFHPDYVKRVSCVLAVMMGTEPQCFQCNLNCKVCRLCCGNRRDNALHVLYECPQLLSTRGSAWLDVINSMPDAMAEHTRGRTDHDKLIFILSGLKGGYIREWQEIYKRIADFVYSMYCARFHLYARLDPSRNLHS